MRKWRSVEEIKALQRQFQKVADDLGIVAEAMIKGGLAEMLCHSEIMFNRRIQEAVGFSCRLRSEVEEQVVALENDRQSHAELMLDRAAREAAKAGVKRRSNTKPKIHRPAK